MKIKLKLPERPRKPVNVGVSIILEYIRALDEYATALEALLKSNERKK